MPNIELHGYEPEAAVEIKEKIHTTFFESPFASEIVTAIVPSKVEDLHGNKMPFLRVISSLDELPDLKQRLTPLNEDVEVIVLGEWIPKRS